MGMAEGLAVADCRAWCTAVFPRPGPLSPGRVPDRLARIQPAAQGGKRVRPGSRKAGWVPAKAASRALQAGDRRRRIFCLKLMREVARPVVLGAGTWLLRKVIKLQGSRRVLRAGSERLGLGRVRTSD